MAKKIFFLSLIMITITANLFSSTVYSADTIDSVIEGADNFLDKGNKVALDENKLKDTSDFLYNLLLAFAMIIAVIIGIVIGIKFMTASIEEKAKIKEALVPYVVGCFVVFGAFGIWKFIVNTMNVWTR